MYIPLRSSDVSEMRLFERRCENYFKKLNMSLSVDVLKKIEGILGRITNSEKGRYYSNYVEKNIK